MQLQELLKTMIHNNASDIFFIPGLPITYRINGMQERIEGESLKPSDTQEIVEQIYEIANRQISPFIDSYNHDDDFSFAIAGIGRFRVNVFRQRGSLAAVIRVIPFELPTAEKYNIPTEVIRLAYLTKGLVLATGPAGAGKSSTLACIIDELNRNRRAHIITMEDPIEFVHSHKNCIVTQREIPTDVATYAEAMRSAMREAPDVLLLGEMTDSETISAAMTAAEMAQLIFSTLHSTGATNTIERIIDAFPPNQQHQIRLQLSMVLQAIVSQQLVPTTDGGVVPAFEILIATPAIRNLIRESKTHQIDNVVAASGAYGMKTMDQSLFDLVQKGIVAKDVAMRYAIHHDALKYRLDTAGI